MFIHTGNYIEQVGNDLTRSTYYTFTPRPLMDGGFYTLDDDLASLLTETHRAIGILEGVLLAFPDGEMFSELMLLKESCFTKMIDYADVDSRSILWNRGLGKPDEDINNILYAYQHVIEADALKASYNDIARRALHGSDPEQKITTRTEPMFLSKSISNYRQYNPTAPGDIHSALNDISKYIAIDGIDSLIKAAMCHYQFEMIHPYDRYNGVVGRILVYKILHSAGLSGVCCLSLSECLYQLKAEYFEKLGLTQKNGSYSSWIVFFVRAIKKSAQEGVELAKGYTELIRCDEEKLSSRSDRTHHTLDVYRHFKKNVASSIGHASEKLQLSFNAISRSIEVLQKLEILTQITSKSKNRLFAHAGLLRLFFPE